MAKMAQAETKKVKVTPTKLKGVPDILIPNGRIESEVTMDLNEKEIRRCMSFADVREVSGEEEITLDPTNYNDAAKVVASEPATQELEPKEDSDAEDSKEE